MRFDYLLIVLTALGNNHACDSTNHWTDILRNSKSHHIDRKSDKLYLHTEYKYRMV